MISLLTAKAFVMIVTFTDTGYANAYEFSDKASCEQYVSSVKSLYHELGQPVIVECVPDNSVEIP